MDAAGGSAGGSAQAMEHGARGLSSKALQIDKGEHELARPSDLLGKVGIRSLLVILGYVLIGYAFYGLRYGWTFIDCFYFAMTTVTTVRRIACSHIKIFLHR